VGDRKGAVKVLMGKPEGRRALERPKRRWENNIKNFPSRNGVGLLNGQT
jgi:hypothetical protein